ncbi:unnamed protein product [Heligmosomoides polygyrus]|uniref:Uncharacterized protein n=1 Tax=Heligmosomoides polygyrus TaxID=6339 RepID=A0A183GN37_HELPZ|nr:unnamed protein product [Heligmosomoides polygyrus]
MASRQRKTATAAFRIGYMVNEKSPPLGDSASLRKGGMDPRRRRCSGPLRAPAVNQVPFNSTGHTRDAGYFETNNPYD